MSKDTSKKPHQLLFPLNQAIEVRESVLLYLKTTYSFSNDALRKAFDEFISSNKTGLFKGPFVSIRTPFLTAAPNEEIPLEVKPSFPPYKHQLEAFKRLTTQIVPNYVNCHSSDQADEFQDSISKDNAEANAGISTSADTTISCKEHKPEPTLLTTGTGSGKTECFLYPILDYCLKCKRRGIKGVKVVIMYPMNALATDQAGRLAKAIHSDPRLNGIKAGLFIGLGKDKKKVDLSQSMSATNIIEDRKEMYKTPPDILLTNFKMLDYSLMRTMESAIWAQNINLPEGVANPLRFLVLDELHTYDGAQGTDVANLIRRLKLKLSLKDSELCPVGTSATIGSGDENASKLCAYASDIFGVKFNEDSIIGESRLSVDEFMPIGSMIPRLGIPSNEALEKGTMLPDDKPEAYLNRNIEAWFPNEGILTYKANSQSNSSFGSMFRNRNLTPDFDAVKLGNALRHTKLVRDILGVLEDSKEKVVSLAVLGRELAKRNQEFASILGIRTKRKLKSEWVPQHGQGRDETDDSSVALHSDSDSHSNSLDQLEQQDQPHKKDAQLTSEDEDYSLELFTEHPHALRVLESLLAMISAARSVVMPVSFSVVDADKFVDEEKSENASESLDSSKSIESQKTLKSQELNEEADTTSVSTGIETPFLFVQVQLWMRELSGLLRHITKLDETPRFEWRVNYTDGLREKYGAALPVFFCHACGESGYLTVRRAKRDYVCSDSASEINRLYAQKNEDVWFMVDGHHKSYNDPDSRNDYYKSHELWLDRISLGLYSSQEDYLQKNPSLTDDEISDRLVPVTLFRSIDRDDKKLQEKCPNCLGHSMLGMVGGRVATMSTVALSQIMSTDFSTDAPEGRRTLTFTNGIQDAAFLAGVYEKRSFRFLLRQSIQEYITTFKKQHPGRDGFLTLESLQNGFINYWKDYYKKLAEASNVNGSVKVNPDAYYYRFLPGDYGTLDLTYQYRDRATNELSAEFREAYDMRLRWEIAAEFGLNAESGRTLEKTCSSGVYFDDMLLRQVYQDVEQWVNDWIRESGRTLREDNPGLAKHLLIPERFMMFLNVFLNRMRLRGAVDHEYLRVFLAEKADIYSLNWNYGKWKPRTSFEDYEDNSFLTREQLERRERVLTKRILAPTFLSYGLHPFALGIGGSEQKNDFAYEFVDVIRADEKSWAYQLFLNAFFYEGESKHNSESLTGLPSEYIVFDFYKILLGSLSEHKILKQVRRSNNGNSHYGKAQDSFVYVLNPSGIAIDNQVRIYKCRSCGRHVYLAKGSDISDAACFNPNCPTGFMVDVTEHEDQKGRGERDYYARVYNRKFTPRVYASDHTGILDRIRREAVELEFKTGLSSVDNKPKCNAVNTLVATSTLEMGIDIGDLNVVSNANIPPSPGNFLQRVGRAGRKSGSALIINYAHRDKDHEMYYFASPSRMMNGQVSTPGCFLGARDILRRHFLAYVLDTWTGIGKDNILERLANREGRAFKGGGKFIDELKHPDFCINRLLNYLNGHKKELLESFIALYPQEQSGVRDATQKLIDYVEDGHLEQAVREAFTKVAMRFDELIATQNALEERIGKRKVLSGTAYAKMRDQLSEEESTSEHGGKYLIGYSLVNNDKLSRGEAEELLATLKGVSNGLKNLRERLVVEHMVLVGLLPNYAFPGAAVQLAGNVISEAAAGDAEENRPENKVIEIDRGAIQALRDFAPGNYFYTDGYKLPIRGVSTIGLNDALTEMKYCSDCDACAFNSEPEFDSAQCPKCGSSSWNSVQNKHACLNFTGAITQVKRSKSEIDRQGGDDRDRQSFRIKKHFTFDPHEHVHSCMLSNNMLGIEMHRTTRITMVNYGNTMDTGDIKIANEEKAASSVGFYVCKTCGRAFSRWEADSASKRREKDPTFFHERFCQHYQIDDPNNEDVYAKVYLHTSMETEAIKVMIPMGDLGPEVTLALFQAIIWLGLREYYSSIPENLEIVPYFERDPNKPDTPTYYLIIYDTIPGGTGYLSRLMEGRAFIDVLEKAWNVLEHCSCQDRGEDGCYDCIWTYGNQHEHYLLSRRGALDLLWPILEQKNIEWREIAGALMQPTRNQKEDSELELRFKNLLRSFAELPFKGNGHWIFKECRSVDDSWYYLEYNQGEEGPERIGFNIHAQVSLEHVEHVRYPTRPDFLFKCVVAIDKDGNKLDAEAIKPLALYLDGYNYHARKTEGGKVNFYADLKKRDALMASGVFDCWTLTWDDVELFKRFVDEKKSNLNAVNEQETDFSPTDWVADDRCLIENLKYGTCALSMKKHEDRELSSNLDSGWKNPVLRFLWVLKSRLVQPDGKYVTKQIYFYLAKFLPLFAKDLNIRALIPNDGVDSFLAGKLQEESALAIYKQTGEKPRLSKYHLLFPCLRDFDFVKSRICLPYLLDTTQGLAMHLEISDADMNGGREIDRAEWSKFWQFINLVYFASSDYIGYKEIRSDEDIEGHFKFKVVIAPKDMSQDASYEPDDNFGISESAQNSESAGSEPENGDTAVTHAVTQGAPSSGSDSAFGAAGENNTLDTAKNSELAEALENYAPEYGDIIRALVHLGIEFNRDGGYWELDSATQEIVADADLGFEYNNQKYVIYPYSDESTLWFKEHGYLVFAEVNEFDLALLTDGNNTGSPEDKFTCDEANTDSPHKDRDN